MKTLGEKRIQGTGQGDERVQEIRNKSAQLIDLLESMREDGAVSGEKHRVISLAQTNFETACMYAVKANFMK